MNDLGHKIVVLALGLATVAVGLHGQEQTNTAQRMMEEDKRLTIGGYGQIDLNQPLEDGTFRNAGLDVHRMVLMFGYKFNEKTQFVSEVEFEHVKEVFVEQAFMQYEIASWLKFRGGLMLVPMGIINEYHEPSTFNGVERPNLDKFIVPSTWREIGVGFAGVFPANSISYQLYLLNGFNGYDGDPNLSGGDGFRKGRQKGAESFMSAPNLTFKLNYFGISGLQLGISGYTGNTQSSLYDGLDKSDNTGILRADSSVVGFTMLGADVHFTLGGFQLKAQLNYGMISNSSHYNEFTGSDLGSNIGGWYGEIAYDLFHSSEIHSTGLIPFIRYEQYHTHASVAEGILLNESYNRSDLTFGLGWKLDSGAMFKLDYQLFSSRATDVYRQQLNAGVAVWF